ncbi:hypothetical protein [Brevundimonas nasdae]|uniref:hypothetical protein n=1 Tax=Brevundimonas nasdae TaxID=172043 RepID=UPI003F6947F6
MGEAQIERPTSPFDGKAFDVENALLMYALSYATMPAEGIYDQPALEPLRDSIKDCHIYLVGLTPVIQTQAVTQDGTNMVTSMSVRGQIHDLRWAIPPNVVLKGDADQGWWGEDEEGRRCFPDEVTIGMRLKLEAGVDFKVLYIGQAFGEEGSRNALDRLRKHETLQKIALQGVPAGYRLTLLMLEIQPGNSTITVINPRAANRSQGSERIRMGLDKLFGTDEAERTTLYEAALIRYFQPPFNTIFKKSFPSTNLKVLADCYDKDFAAVVAEISIDELPFTLFSDTVAHRHNHIAKFDLHDDEARRVFFA